MVPSFPVIVAVPATTGDPPNENTGISVVDPPWWTSVEAAVRLVAVEPGVALQLVAHESAAGALPVAPLPPKLAHRLVVRPVVIVAADPDPDCVAPAVNEPIFARTVAVTSCETETPSRFVTV